MNRYFIDTFYLIALHDQTDESHELVRVFSAEEFTGITTRWVLTEFANTFSTGPDREEVAKLIEALLGSSNNIVVPTTNEWFDRGLSRFKSRVDKEWSPTDCISFLVMEEFGLREALTGDHHFEQAGFVALLK